MAGVNYRCLDFDLHYIYSKTNNNYYAKIQKNSNDIVPRLYLSELMFKAEDMPEWNPRQICTFTFSAMKNTKIKSVMAQMDTNTSYPLDGYVCFNICMVKPRLENQFFAITAGEIPSDGMLHTIDETSFTPVESGVIKYLQYPSILVYEFYCGFDNKLDVYNLTENANQEQKLLNMMYLTRYKLTTGNIVPELNDFQVKPLIRPILPVTCTVLAMTPWIEMPNNPFFIPTDDTNYHVVRMKTINFVDYGIVPLLFTSDDPVYNTFNERIKVVAGIEFVIVATASGLSLSNYTIEMRVVDFRIVNKKGETLTTVNIGEATDFYITILPPDALYELDNATITFQIQNSNSTVLTAPSAVIFPSKDQSGNVLAETIFEVTSTGEELADTVTLDFDIVSNLKFFNVFDVTPAQVNISSLQLNTTKMLINIKDPVNPIFSIIARLAPTRVGDIDEDMYINAVTTPSSIAARTFYFKVTFSENKFIVKEVQTLAVTLKTFFYDSENTMEAFVYDTLEFDVSDESNAGQKLTFFAENTLDAGELIDGDGLPIAEYSRNLPAGKPGAWVRITAPNLPKIYYRTSPFNALQNWGVYGFGTVNLLPLVYKDVGTFTIAPLLVDGTGGEFSFVSNGEEGQVDIALTIPNNDLFGKASIPTVSANVITVDRPRNLKFSIFQASNVRLNWFIDDNDGVIYSFADPLRTRYLVSVKYEILKQTLSKDEIASQSDLASYEVIGTSDICEYIDYGLETFTNVRYRVRSLITWEGTTVASSVSEPLFVFVCELNRFPDGRYNNSHTNQKLYQPLNQSCKLFTDMAPKSRVTGNLFPNSTHLTRKQTFALLSGKLAPKR
jgi:hypothetical protein